MNTCFVVLNYNNYLDTIECIESIIKCDLHNIKIVVVDNNSTNNSADIILKHFEGNSDVVVLKSTINLGYSKGNNMGYTYCKSNYDVKYIIVLNNDTLVLQKSFIDNIDRVFMKTNFHLLGPNIITLNGVHQNPQRKSGLTTHQLLRLIKKIKLLLFILKFIPFAYIVMQKLRKKKSSIVDWYTPQSNVQIHGACIIYSYIYIESNDFAFLPITFLFMEEDILYKYCLDKSYKIEYNPLVEIIHKEDGSTNTIVKGNIQKQIFVYTNALHSANALLRYMEGKND